jgi:dATP pyrophosphohydrolase
MNTEHVFSVDVRQPVPLRLATREHLRYVWLPWRAAAERCFSWTNRDAILALPEFVERRARGRTEA